MEWLNKDMLIDEAVNKFPVVAEYLGMEGIHCVGCVVANVETLEQGIAGHGRDSRYIKSLVDELNSIVGEEYQKADSYTIRMTDIAAKHIKDTASDGLRLEVRLTSFGSPYQLSLEGRKSKTDLVFEKKGAKVFVGRHHIAYLHNTLMDWDEVGKGFLISPNQNF